MWPIATCSPTPASNKAVAQAVRRPVIGQHVGSAAGDDIDFVVDGFRAQRANAASRRVHSPLEVLITSARNYRLVSRARNTEGYSAIPNAEWFLPDMISINGTVVWYRGTAPP